ncbi:MAG: hypothetical protein ACPL5I_16805 [Thermodesulfobacteriota bacterium]
MGLKTKLSYWLIFLLIFAFFAIPVLALSLADQVTKWPKCPAAAILQILPK